VTISTAKRDSKHGQTAINLPERRVSILPYLLLALMIVATLAMGIITSLGTFYFMPAFPHTALGAWLLTPAHILFPGHALIDKRIVPSPALFGPSWLEAAFLLGSFCLLFLIFILALVFLSRRVSYRFIFFSACVIGLTFLIIPSLASQDIFSYIIYARIGVIYHLNPLTTLPMALPHKDIILEYIYWKTQPSAYGATWIAITSLLQMFAGFFPSAPLLSMVFLLRLWGLIMLLGSLHLLWSITGRQQRLHGFPSQRTRLIAALAVGWNPFLFFEGVMNAHIDMTIVFFIFLTFCALQRFEQRKWLMPALTSLILALTVCLKVNVVIFFPGLLLFLWTQRKQTVSLRLQRIGLATLCFVGPIFLLYAPFWQHGAVLDVFRINPGLTRDVNSPYDFFLHLELGIHRQILFRPNNNVGAPQEIVTHKISDIVFSLAYALVCIWFLILPDRMNNLPGLIGWMALIWLVYCITGSAWYMPWYILTFLGLIALLMGLSPTDKFMFGPVHLSAALWIMSFSMLLMYFFSAYAPSSTHITYFLTVGALRELLVWLVLLFALRYPLLRSAFKQRMAALQMFGVDLYAFTQAKIVRR
jgi:hypothetical protein